MNRVLIIFVILISSFPAAAEMYQWVGEDGSVTFKDTPPPSSKKRKKVKVYSDSDFDPAPPLPPSSTGRFVKSSAKPTATATSTKERFSGTVEIYLTDWCGYCKQAISYMSKKGIPYVTYNIEKDSSAAQRHKELGGRGVPLIIIGANKMSGFSEQNLEYYLDNSK